MEFNSDHTWSERLGLWIVSTSMFSVLQQLCFNSCFNISAQEVAYNRNFYVI